MSSVQLSVIVPVYRAAAYIEDCLNSVVEQIDERSEIVLVDDGSPDESVSIIMEKFGAQIESGLIRLLRQHNQGPGAARNAGIDASEGKYLGFLDSDDVLLPEYFSNVFEVIADGSIDIVEFGFKTFEKVCDLPSIQGNWRYDFVGTYDIEDVRNIVFSRAKWFPSVRVFRRELFESVRFPIGVFYEDLMTIPWIYMDRAKVCFLEYPLIGYRVNPASTTQNHSVIHGDHLWHFFCLLDSKAPTIPIRLLMITTGRTIAYFYSELGKLNFSIDQFLSRISKIEKSAVLLNLLSARDLFFVLAPRLYIQIETLRLRKRIARFL